MTGEGLAAAATAFAKVFATVWAGSQVTKLARAGGCVRAQSAVHKSERFDADIFTYRNTFLPNVTLQSSGPSTPHGQGPGES